VAGHKTTPSAAQTLDAAARKKGLGSAGQPFGAQSGYRMWRRRSKVHYRQAYRKTHTKIS
jgi:hypothetical protein